VIYLDDQELIDLFRENGFKVTAQRLAVGRYILSREDHPSAEQIHNALTKEYPTISLGTIYKTLHLLKDIGLIQELGFTGSSIRYDPDTELHINMVCTKCGQIHDYKPNNLKELWEKILSQINIEPEGQRIDVYYECIDCKNKP